MKRHAPATARNSGPLSEVLASELPDRGLVLEVASGTGEHAVFMARRFPLLEWQPTDSDPEALASVNAWIEEARLENLRAGLTLDAAEADWPIGEANAVLCVNMVHISPWIATEGLFKGASRVLSSGSPLILYGPFLEEEVQTAQSNLAFDQDLRRRDASWGLRRLEEVDRVALQNGLARTARYEMPANNLTLVYRK